MTPAETPVPSQADRIEQALARIEGQVARLTDATNVTGQLVQSVVDNASGIFRMFTDPQMMGMMSGMLGGGIPPVPANLTGVTASDQPADGTAGPAAGASDGPAVPAGG